MANYNDLIAHEKAYREIILDPRTDAKMRHDVCAAYGDILDELGDFRSVLVNKWRVENHGYNPADSGQLVEITDPEIISQFAAGSTIKELIRNDNARLFMSDYGTRVVLEHKCKQPDWFYHELAGEVDAIHINSHAPVPFVNELLAMREKDSSIPEITGLTLYTYLDRQHQTEIGEMIAKLDNLDYLDFIYQTDISRQQLGPALEGKNKLRTLRITNSTGMNSADLASLFADKPNLQHLELTASEINNADLETGLQEKSQLRALCLSNSDNINNNELCRVLNDKDQLRNLTISRNITRDALARALHDKKFLRDLGVHYAVNLSYADIGEAIKDKPELQRLSLYYTGNGQSGLTEMLDKCGSLRGLELSLGVISEGDYLLHPGLREMQQMWHDGKLSNLEKLEVQQHSIPTSIYFFDERYHDRKQIDGLMNTVRMRRSDPTPAGAGDIAGVSQEVGG